MYNENETAVFIITGNLEHILELTEWKLDATVCTHKNAANIQWCYSDWNPNHHNVVVIKKWMFDYLLCDISIALQPNRAT